LEIVRDLAFPLFIVERSPLVTRDLDLLIEIKQRAWVGVVFSLSNLDVKLKHVFEPRSPGLQRRLQAIAELANAGILVGTTLMPIIPFASDDRAHLEEVVRATKDHGGSFVLAGGLSMEGVQAQRTLSAARRLDPALEARWRQFYKWNELGKPNYSPPREYGARLGLLVRELCERHGMKDRMPRYLGTGPLAINRQIAERLFLKTYELELAQAQSYRIWAYRKAAWAIDEWPESLAEIFRQQGESGLQKLPGIGKGIVAEISQWLKAHLTESSNAK
jgi:DNA repair photolyase